MCGGLEDLEKNRDQLKKCSRKDPVPGPFPPSSRDLGPGRRPTAGPPRGGLWSTRSRTFDGVTRVGGSPLRSLLVGALAADHRQRSARAPGIVLRNDVDPNAARPSSAEAGWSWPPTHRGSPSRPRGSAPRSGLPPPASAIHGSGSGAGRCCTAAPPEGPYERRPRDPARVALPARSCAPGDGPVPINRGVSWRPCRSSWWPSSGRSGPARRRWSSPARPRASWCPPRPRPPLGQLAEGGVVTIRTDSGEDVIVAAHGGFLSITERGCPSSPRPRRSPPRSTSPALARRSAARRAPTSPRPSTPPACPVAAAGRRRGRLSHR